MTGDQRSIGFYSSSCSAHVRTGIALKKMSKIQSTADLRTRTALYISLSSHKIWLTKMNPD